MHLFYKCPAPYEFLPYCPPHLFDLWYQHCCVCPQPYVQPLQRFPQPAVSPLQFAPGPKAKG